MLALDRKLIPTVGPHRFTPGAKNRDDHNQPTQAPSAARCASVTRCPAGPYLHSVNGTTALTKLPCSGLHSWARCAVRHEAWLQVANVLVTGPLTSIALTKCQICWLASIKQGTFPSLLPTTSRRHSTHHALLARVSWIIHLPFLVSSLRLSIDRNAFCMMGTSSSAKRRCSSGGSVRKVLFMILMA